MRQNFVESTHHEQAVGILNKRMNKNGKIRKNWLLLRWNDVEEIEHKVVPKIDQKSKRRRYLNLCKRLKGGHWNYDLHLSIFTGLDLSITTISSCLCLSFGTDSFGNCDWSLYPIPFHLITDCFLALVIRALLFRSRKKRLMYKTLNHYPPW